ncbi:hypothetical protein BDP81DRAFT_431520 [Colletotrichum phormii]|uniref:Major facilitator superfamily (MFS) profile domain-containing protein n=1 Tax=Colletotrichum phormii TaxID=359342 RepID=A0AAI9ZPA4_9PEZI|nr:uncharacterized protein BDP81DRAFT_431520 [Colletotrichum phormii]KAK1634563.1 hypothetical protein BDP81DRAFT_431520 [Colletotrichum phormii]
MIPCTRTSTGGWSSLAALPTSAPWVSASTTGGGEALWVYPNSNESTVPMMMNSGDELGRYAIPAEKTSVGTGTGSAGIIIGCIIAPLVTSRLGRKKSFLVISALMGTGVVLESSAVTSFWQLVVGRILVYAGMELTSNVTPHISLGMRSATD